MKRTLLIVLILMAAVLGSILGWLAVAQPKISGHIVSDLHLISQESKVYWSPAWTGPIQAATILAWLAEHGYPAFIGDFNGDSVIDELDTIELADIFGLNLMETRSPRGTTDVRLILGLARYVADRYPNQFELKIYDAGFPAEFSAEEGMAFNPHIIDGIVLNPKNEPSIAAYKFELESGEGVIVGLEEEENYNTYLSGRSFLYDTTPEGYTPIDLAWAEEARWVEGHQGKVLETVGKMDDLFYLEYRGEWARVEFMLALSPTNIAGAAGPGDPDGEPDNGEDDGEDGACCFRNEAALCIEMSEAECDDEGGASYYVDGASCDELDCGRPRGACCRPDMPGVMFGFCSEETETTCNAGVGTYYGDGSLCEELDPPCDEPDDSEELGACCIIDWAWGTAYCDERTSSECRFADGTYYGAGSSCGDSEIEIDCALPERGACCLPDGWCGEESEANCDEAGGTYYGDESLCEEIRCDEPLNFFPRGACCNPNGGCDEETEAGCDEIGGTYYGDRTFCEEVRCDEPDEPDDGACCLADGTCVEMDSTQCKIYGGTYEGDGTACWDIDCEPDEPDEPDEPGQPDEPDGDVTGACVFVINQGCAVMSAAECTGRYLGDGTTCP